MKAVEKNRKQNVECWESWKKKFVSCLWIGVRKCKAKYMWTDQYHYQRAALFGIFIWNRSKSVAIPHSRLSHHSIFIDFLPIFFVLISSQRYSVFHILFCIRMIFSPNNFRSIRSGALFVCSESNWINLLVCWCICVFVCMRIFFRPNILSLSFKPRIQVEWKKAIKFLGTKKKTIANFGEKSDIQRQRRQPRQIEEEENIHQDEDNSKAFYT